MSVKTLGGGQVHMKTLNTCFFPSQIHLPISLSPYTLLPHCYLSLKSDSDTTLSSFIGFPFFVSQQTFIKHQQLCQVLRKVSPSLVG